jgi:hypothetical protein
MSKLSHKRANLLLQGMPHADDRPVEQLEQRPTCRGHVNAGGLAELDGWRGLGGLGRLRGGEKVV